MESKFFDRNSSTCAEEQNKIFLHKQRNFCCKNITNCNVGIENNLILLCCISDKIFRFIIEKNIFLILLILRIKFLTGLLGTVMSRSMPPVRQNTLERMNIKRSELKQICDAKGDTLYGDIRAKHIAFTLNLTERFMTWKKEASSTEDVYKLVQERCNKDVSLKEMLKNFVESSQLCMDAKDHLNDDKLVALTSRLMELFCAQYTHSKILFFTFKYV